MIALLAVGGLYLALPDSLAAGPRWLQLAVVAVLLVPTIISRRIGRHGLNMIFGHIVAGVVTLFTVWSLVLLVLALPGHKEPPVALLRSAVALWISNVLVFALWYWRLDVSHGAFLFPQMTRPDAHKPWTPQFLDYLFLAFNTSTAFSPTDTAVLSRWAKLMVMTQSSISLTVVVILAGRAVNIL